MKSNKIRFPDLLTYSVIIFIAFQITKNIASLPQWVSWSAFFPYKVLFLLVEKVQLSEDLFIIFMIIVGIPLVIIYWFFLFKMIKGLIVYFFE